MEIVIVLLVLIGLYFSLKATLKQRMMQSNFLVSSEATSETINSMQSEEEKLQEERLMKNKRYRMLKSVLVQEAQAIQSLTIDQARTKLTSGKKIIHVEGAQVVVKLDVSQKEVKISVYPNHLLGSIFAVDGWVKFKS